jgi:hypothetical protein
VTPIAEKQLVRAPLASANRLLQGFLAANPAPKGAGARVLLRAGDAAQPALIVLQPAHRPQDMTPHYKVHWAAESGGPFPVFDGELSVGSDEDYNAFWLVLNGVYAPPGGIAGQLFDAVIGRRIADGTARGLLEEMRVAIESAFAEEERLKGAQPSER